MRDKNCYIARTYSCALLENLCSFACGLENTFRLNIILSTSLQQSLARISAKSHF